MVYCFSGGMHGGSHCDFGQVDPVSVSLVYLRIKTIQPQEDRLNPWFKHIRQRARAHSCWSWKGRSVVFRVFFFFFE